MMQEIDHDATENLSRDEIIDLYEEKTRQISDLYAERRPLEHRIWLLMEEKGATKLKSEESEVKVASEQGRELSPTMQISIAEAMVKALAKMKQEMEFNSQPKLIVSKRNKGKGANINEKSK